MALTFKLTLSLGAFDAFDWAVLGLADEGVSEFFCFFIYSNSSRYTLFQLSI